MNATLTPTKEVFQNYAQLRAKHAWEAAQKGGFTGTSDDVCVVKDVPSMIIENGLLGAMAFAIEKNEAKKRIVGYYNTFEAIRQYLVKVGSPSAKGTNDVNIWFKELASSSAEVLRITTSESMAYLSYLRRFAKPDKRREGNE